MNSASSCSRAALRGRSVGWSRRSGGTRTLMPGSSRSFGLARLPSTRSSPLRTMLWTRVKGRNGKRAVRKRSMRMPASSGSTVRVCTPEARVAEAAARCSRRVGPAGGAEGSGRDSTDRVCAFAAGLALGRAAPCAGAAHPCARPGPAGASAWRQPPRPRRRRGACPPRSRDRARRHRRRGCGRRARRRRGRWCAGRCGRARHTAETYRPGACAPSGRRVGVVVSS